MDEELTLTDLIDIETLQQIQDAFCHMTGLAAVISDANGVAITNETGYQSVFCKKLTKGSPLGLSRCQKCDKQGGELALATGCSVCYRCHAGLIDFAAPIMANGKMIGVFVGGQVLNKPLDEEHIIKTAKEIGVDPEIYLEAARKIKIIDKDILQRSTTFLYTIANILSNFGYSGYLALKANADIERAARMKSDFLANMSHEIRTPMNAVIGMAEMALREDLTPVARSYINQIKASGKTLLAIINDILDFSKIESGKMDITLAEYAPMSIINDVANTIMTRIADKDVELFFDVTPDIPYELIGDSIRIKQILINIANNAVKFTNSGHVTIRMDYDRIADNEVELTFAVQDTGIGIKKEDLGKLFQSFQQVDSKRNRNIEGTGLGLAISKQLLTLMDGDITVTSEYGKGSIFYFSFPQQINDGKPSVVLKGDEPVIAAGLIDNSDVSRHLEKDVVRLGATYIHLQSENDFYLIDSQNVKYLFVEQAMFSDEIEKWVIQHPNVLCILMVNFSQDPKYDIPNLKIIKKPLYCLNIAMIFNDEDIYSLFGMPADEDFKFVAPEANILIVDDNAINLTVAEGLLEPMKMNIDTAISGMDAISKISVKHYDLIFMDHMMPELDGVETTHIIRRFHHEYDDVPIIALTANAVDGTKEMFLNEGLNDFVAKPIELRVITSVLKKWLPPEKIQKLTSDLISAKDEAAAGAETEDFVIEGLDTASALKLLGNRTLFFKVLKDYYTVIEKKARLIKDYETAEDWPNYTVEVHALKSASKQIGAMELSALAADMEKAGNARNKVLIHRQTDEMLEMYLKYNDILAPYFPEEQAIDDSEKQDATPEIMHNLFQSINEALDNLDMDQLEEVVEQLKRYRYSEKGQKFFEQFLSAAAEWDIDACMSIIDKWAALIQEN